MLTDSEIRQFRGDLLRWFFQHKRDLPWRRTRDPYAIWISEIMLQQTRVAAAIPYYERFLARFPDFTSLAEAPESDLLAHWAGLGYYHRARNLHRAAQFMQESGAFPETYAAIRALPGVGEYTAAAVASIAFGLPHAVLDGNVHRVLARLFADASINRAHFSTLAETLLDAADPASFNQAMMELGATVCLPKNPQCLVCPVSQFCLARQTGTQMDFPVKAKAQRNAPEHRTLFWIEERGRVLAWQRPPEEKLMAGFWELPEAAQIPDAIPDERLGSFRHGITVHHYVFTVVRANPPAASGPCNWIEPAAVQPLSTIFKKALRIAGRLVSCSHAAP